MTGAGELLFWWNAIFALPLGLALFYLLVTIVFGLEHGGADHDHDHDHDPNPNHDLEADDAVEAEASDGIGIDDLFLFLGGQSVSVTLLIELLLINWGAVGLIANALLAPLLPRPALFIGPSVLLALLGSLSLTSVTTRLLGRLLPKEESAALGHEELEGLVGQAIFSIDEKGGVVHVYDRFGSLHQVACRTVDGAISRGTKVILVEYLRDGHCYLVEPTPEELDPDWRTSNEQPVRQSGSADDEQTLELPSGDAT